MPLPLAPIAGLALRYGAVAVATYAATRHLPKVRRDQRAEDVLDDLDDGLSVSRDAEDTRVAGRYRRTVRFGEDGPGFEIDASGFGRVRFRKV